MNRPNRETLDVFGRILYALAMADGAVQDEEIHVLHEIVLKDKWAKEIELSFDKAIKLDMDPRITFFKNMRIFQTLDDEQREYFLELMEKVANAYGGVIPEERDLITKFKSNLKGGFMESPHAHSVTVA